MAIFADFVARTAKINSCIKNLLLGTCIAYEAPYEQPSRSFIPHSCYFVGRICAYFDPIYTHQYTNTLDQCPCAWVHADTHFCILQDTSTVSGLDTSEFERAPLWSSHVPLIQYPSADDLRLWLNLSSSFSITMKSRRCTLSARILKNKQPNPIQMGGDQLVLPALPVLSPSDI